MGTSVISNFRNMGCLCGVQRFALYDYCLVYGAPSESLFVLKMGIASNSHLFLWRKSVGLNRSTY